MNENKNLLNKLLTVFSKQEDLDELLALTMHRDGHKRENAVRRLGLLGNPVAIPKLIVRANNWVPQVRQAAKESLAKLMKSENAQAFVCSLPNLYHLQNCGLDKHEELINNVKNFLLRPENVSHLQAAIVGKEAAVVRIAVKLCVENNLIENGELAMKCFAHQDIIVRAYGAQLLKSLNGENFNTAFAKAIRDPFMPIRREAFQIYLMARPNEGLKIAESLLFDKHFSIRKIALNQLKNSGFDVETLYSIVLHKKSNSALRLRCAIWGLAELGQKSSRADIENLTKNSLPSVREAALQALTKLTGEAAKPMLAVGLRDQSPSVAKESARLLQQYGIGMNVKELLEIIGASEHSQTYLVCATLARKFNKWDRLIFLMNLHGLLKDQNNSVLEFVNQELIQWDYFFNRNGSQPTEDQLKRLSELYKACAPLVNNKSIAFTLKSYGAKI